MEWTVLISPIASAMLAFAGSYLAFTNRITRLEALIEALTERVEKHNNVIERTYKLEADVSHLQDDVHNIKRGGTE